MSLKEDIEDILHPEKKNKMLNISLERLTPPMAPKPIPPDLIKSIMSHEIEPIIKGGKRVISSEQSVDRNTRVGSEDTESLKEPTRTVEKQSLTDSRLGIDYEEIARSSEFQRFIYFLLTGKTHRGKQVDLRRDVTAKMTKFRGSGMGDVINEFKEKVKRLRNEENR